MCSEFRVSTTPVATFRNRNIDRSRSPLRTDMTDSIVCKGSQVCSPFLGRDSHAHDTLYYVSAGTGEVFAYSLSQNTHTSVVFSGGEPYGAQFDSRGRLHIADAAHAALLRVDEHGQPAVMVKAYEEKPFRGPSSIAFARSASSDTDCVYFTDCGPLGETTLERPRGSLFYIGPSPTGGQTLRPLAWECLAHPSCVSVDPGNPQVLYVTETMANRLLRVVQGPTGSHFISVFYQFSGGLGPSCVVCDRSGAIYVGHFDLAGYGASKGKISVLNSQGVLTRTLEVPGPEISGICISHDNTALFVTEASTNSIYRVSV